MSAHDVPKKPAADSSQDPSAKDRPEPTKPAGKRTGAPRNNVNAAKDPMFTKTMREAKRLAKRGRRRRLRECEAAAQAIIAAVGLQDHPLAQRLASRLAEIEHEVDELDRIVERAGRTKRDGSLSPSYERRLNLIAQDRQELRHLIDRLAEVQASAEPGDTIYTASLPIPDSTAPPCEKCGAQPMRHIPLSDRDAEEESALNAFIGTPAPAGEAISTSPLPLPSEAEDAAETPTAPEDEPAPEPKPTQPEQSNTASPPPEADPPLVDRGGNGDPRKLRDVIQDAGGRRRWKGF